jgi:hypothetical protein
MFSGRRVGKLEMPTQHSRFLKLAASKTIEKIQKSKKPKIEKSQKARNKKI